MGRSVRLAARLFLAFVAWKSAAAQTVLPPPGSRGNQFLFTSPVESRIFATACSVEFNSNTDNVYNVSYNVDCLGQRIVPTEHAFQMQLETSYDALPDPGRQDYLEWNWNWWGKAGVCVGGADPGTSCISSGDCPDDSVCDFGWRPFGFAMFVPGNSEHGSASYFWKTNNNDLGANFALELRDKHIALNRNSATDSSADAAVSSFMRTSDKSGAVTYTAHQSKITFDHGSAAANVFPAFNALLDFSPAGKSTGYAIGFLVNTPTAPGPDSVIVETDGTYIGDLHCDRAGMNRCNAHYVASQTTTDGSQSNDVTAGTGYNHGHRVIGSTHVWQQRAGILRTKGGTPTADADGNAISTGTGSDSHGLTLWGVTTAMDPAFDTGDEVCAASGHACVGTADRLGVEIPCDTAHSVVDHWLAFCK